MKDSKLYHLSATAKAKHTAGERILYKVDPGDDGPTTFSTLQRHDWVYDNGHSISYYVVVATGSRIPDHVVQKWLQLGYLTECTSPGNISRPDNPQWFYSLAA